RLQSFLACAEREPSGRSRVPSGPFESWHLRAFVSGRPHRRAAARFLPHGSRRARTWPFLVSASVADAGILAGADRVDGTRAAPGDLSGAFLEVPRKPRTDSAERPQSLVLHRRRRIG